MVRDSKSGSVAVRDKILPELATIPVGLMWESFRPTAPLVKAYAMEWLSSQPETHCSRHLMDVNAVWMQSCDYNVARPDEDSRTHELSEVECQLHSFVWNNGWYVGPRFWGSTLEEVQVGWDFEM